VQAIPPTSIMNSLMPDVAGMDEPRSAVIAPVVAPVVEQRRR
jgi:hypothetical protein